VKYTRYWCIFNSAVVALISSMLSATCDLIAQEYFPIAPGQGTNVHNWSLWRFYLMAGLFIHFQVSDCLNVQQRLSI
jgi:hypothetical protein